MPDTLTTVFLTKYALTHGIKTATVERIDEIGTAYVRLQKNAEVVSFIHIDWAKTREDAVKKAEAMREAAICELEEQIERLRRMNF